MPDDEYTLKNGINYRADGFAFCDRCGSTQVVNHLCLKCDVTPTEMDQTIASEIRSRCYSPRQAPMKGVFDGRPEKFDVDRAARVIAAMREPILQCGACGKCLDCIRRERSHGVV